VSCREKPLVMGEFNDGSLLVAWVENLENVGNIDHAIYRTRFMAQHLDGQSGAVLWQEAEVVGNGPLVGERVGVL